VRDLAAGSSKNPRKLIISKPEKVLGKTLSAEAKEERTDEAIIEGLSGWFDFDPNDKPEWLPSSGICVRYNISHRPIYVSQAQKFRIGSMTIVKNFGSVRRSSKTPQLSQSKTKN
jgi:hypothetical protein